MDASDMIEEATVLEIKNTNTPDITQVLEGDIIKEEVTENTEVDESDFEGGDIAPKEIIAKAKKGEEETTTEELDHDKSKGKETTQENTPENDRKQGAVVRLMKTSMLITVFNSVARRVGKIANPKNPECLTFDKEDTTDLGILLEETVKEESWSGFPTKYLLLVVVGLIIVSKIFAWNKPAAKIEASQNNNIGANDETKKMLEQMQVNFNELKEQNKMLKDLLDKKIEAGKPSKMFKGYDLSKLQFTKNGAIIDPSKAGEKGYASNGAKMGIPSHGEKELYNKWKEYNEVMEEA